MSTLARHINHPLPPSPLPARICSVNMGPGGMDALVALGGGDMRRSLNILQVCVGADL